MQTSARPDRQSAPRLTPPAVPRGWLRSRPWVTLAAVTAVALVWVILLGDPSAGQAGAVGTPCPEVFPAGAGTPVAPGEAEPAPPDAVETCADAGLGTPLPTDGLVVTLEADNLTAGPRDLTVVVVDADGQPVTGATVGIRTRSLAMDHGVSIDETVETEPGRYFAERVSLGMGGDWLAEVTIERPDTEPVVLYFVLTLEGPEH